MLLIVCILSLITVTVCYQGCGVTFVMECLKDTQQYQGRNSLLYQYNNKTALRMICTKLENGLQCMDDAVDRCIKSEEIANNYFDMMNVIKTTLVTFCSGDVSKDDVEAFKCMQDQSNNINRVCRRQLKDMGQYRRRSRDRGSADRKACRLFGDYRGCLLDSHTRFCGSRSADLLDRNVIRKLLELPEFRRCSACDVLSSIFVTSIAAVFIVCFSNKRYF